MNEALRLILNRETGFNSTAFPTTTTFTPAPASAEATAVRKLFCLEDGQPDWYVMGALSTLYAYPIYWDMLNETQRTYKLEAYQRPQERMAGGSLQPSPIGPPRVARVPIEWPIQFEIRVLFNTATTAWLHHAGSSQILNVRTLDKRLLFDWPETTGVRGEVLLDLPWAADSEFRIFHDPVSYPHALLVGLLDNSVAAQHVLNRSTLAGSYYSARDASEKVAIMLAALAIEQQNHE